MGSEARQGANLLFHMAYAIKNGAPLIPLSTDGAAPSNFVVYVGHDNNIANVAGLLVFSGRSEIILATMSRPARHWPSRSAATRARRGSQTTTRRGKQPLQSQLLVLIFDQIA